MVQPFKDLVDSRKQIPVFSDESLEDLQRAGYRMIQKKQGFRFGTDSVLLAAYVAEYYKKTPDRTLKAADFCAGSGAVSLLLAARLKNADITGFEIDPASCDVFKRNTRLNKIENKINIQQADLRTFFDPKKQSGGSEKNEICFEQAFDLIICNPPYQKPERNYGFKHRNDSDNAQFMQEDQMRIACWEKQLPLDDLLKAAAFALKQSGLLFMVHRAHRLPEVIDGLHKHHFAPVNLRMVQSFSGRSPSVFLIAARYRGKAGGFRVEPVFVLYETPDCLSHEAALWYGHETPLSDTALWQNVRKIEKLSTTERLS